MSSVSQPLNIAVLTISDTRTLETDKSGDYLHNALSQEGHVLEDRALVKDDIYQQRAIVSQWIAKGSCLSQFLAYLSVSILGFSILDFKHTGLTHISV